MEPEAPAKTARGGRTTARPALPDQPLALYAAAAAGVALVLVGLLTDHILIVLGGTLAAIAVVLSASRE